MSNKSSMQVAVVNTESALTMPTGQFLEVYLHPIEDDTWIRHAELVHLENLIETEGGELIKKEILSDYIEEHNKLGRTPDPILEGMLFQEEFISHYKMMESSADKSRAHGYRQQLVKHYRSKHGQRTSAVDPPCGEKKETYTAAAVKDSNQDELKSLEASHADEHFVPGGSAAAIHEGDELPVRAVAVAADESTSVDAEL